MSHDPQQDETATQPIGLGPRQIGPYSVDGKLGEGGMGVVYRGWDARLRRKVAIKMLRGQSPLGSTHRERFQTEARAASALSHPHICTVYDVGEENGEPYLVLEYLEGETLRERLTRGPLPIDEIETITGQVKDALETAHGKGIVHRDIKPANIFLVARDSGKIHAKVMDFGLAKFARLDTEASTAAMLTEAGAAIGTVAYMSPEQARGEELDARTDWFSLGVTLYEMASGQRPFRGATTAAIFDAILNREPEPLTRLRRDLPQHVVGLAERWLQKDRNQRMTALPPARARMKGKTGWIAAAVVSITMIGAAGLYRWLALAPEVHSLAVLPFAADGANADFAVGISEAIGEDLARAKQQLRVASRGAAGLMRGKSVEEASRTLNVDAVLVGEILGDAANMSVASRLVAGNGRVLWEATLPLDRGSLYSTQRNLVQQVREAIGLQQPAAPRTGHEPKNNEAYDLYLRSRVHTSTNSEPELDLAIKLLEKAAALDPQYLPIQAYLAYAYCSKAFSYKPNDAALEEKGFAAVQRALSIDPEAAEAHYGQALMLWRPSHGFQNREALSELRKALAANPDFDEAWHQHSLVLSHVGHVEAALRDLEQALRANPGNTIARARSGVFHIYVQRFQQAVDLLDRVPRTVFPNWPYQRTWALLSLGRNDEAEREIEATLAEKRPDQGGTIHSARAMLRAQRGDRKGAEADIAEAIRVGGNFGHFHHTAYSIGAVYSVMGNMEKAYEWVERAANTGFPCYSFYETDPFLARAREVPKFKALLARMRSEWEHIPGEE